jgi:hypothetical protein
MVRPAAKFAAAIYQNVSVCQELLHQVQFMLKCRMHMHEMRICTFRELCMLDTRARAGGHRWHSSNQECWLGVTHHLQHWYRWCTADGKCAVFGGACNHERACRARGTLTKCSNAVGTHKAAEWSHKAAVWTTEVTGVRCILRRWQALEHASWKDVRCAGTAEGWPTWQGQHGVLERASASARASPAIARSFRRANKHVRGQLCR